MAMGTRETDQPPLWIATSDLPVSPGHPFYTRLNALLEAHDFDRSVEDVCGRFYAPVMGRPGLALSSGRLVAIPGCCWSTISKGSTRNAGLPAHDRLVGAPQFSARGPGRSPARSFDDFEEPVA